MLACTGVRFNLRIVSPSTKPRSISFFTCNKWPTRINRIFAGLVYWSHLDQEAGIICKYAWKEKRRTPSSLNFCSRSSRCISFSFLLKVDGGGFRRPACCAGREVRLAAKEISATRARNFSFCKTSQAVKTAMDWKADQFENKFKWGQVDMSIQRLNNDRQNYCCWKYKKMIFSLS